MSTGRGECDIWDIARVVGGNTFSCLPRRLWISTLADNKSALYDRLSAVAGTTAAGRQVVIAIATPIRLTRAMARFIPYSFRNVAICRREIRTIVGFPIVTIQSVFCKHRSAHRHVVRRRGEPTHVLPIDRNTANLRIA